MYSISNRKLQPAQPDLEGFEMPHILKYRLRLTDIHLPRSVKIECQQYLHLSVRLCLIVQESRRLPLEDNLH